MVGNSAFWKSWWEDDPLGLALYSRVLTDLEGRHNYFSWVKKNLPEPENCFEPDRSTPVFEMPSVLQLIHGHPHRFGKFYQGGGTMFVVNSFHLR